MAGWGTVWAVATVGTAPPAAQAGYRYGGYQPAHAHAGEMAVLWTPATPVRLKRWSDHDAAYVDVSNSRATVWGQTGWWVGTSGSGILLRQPVGYAEYRLFDGTYRWIGLGRPPRQATYRVVRTSRRLRDPRGGVWYLYRLQVSYVAGTVDTFPFPSSRGWNAGLAESYSSPGVREPIGPARYEGVALQDAGHWRRWRPWVDRAVRSQSPGDQVVLGRAYDRWWVYGSGQGQETSSRPVFLRAQGERGGVGDALPQGMLLAPVGLRSWVHGGQVGTLGTDGQGRLVGSLLRPSGEVDLWRYRLGWARPQVWRVPHGRERLGLGGTWVARKGGGAVLAAGRWLAFLPPGEGPLTLWPLPPGGEVGGAAPGPSPGSLLLSREGEGVLWRWQPGPPAHLVPMPLPWGMRAGGALVRVGRRRYLLALPDDRPWAFAHLAEVRLGPGAALTVRRLAVGGVYLAEGAGVAAAAGGSGGGVALMGRARVWRPAAWAQVAPWGDPVAIDPQGWVWTLVAGPRQWRLEGRGNGSERSTWLWPVYVHPSRGPAQAARTPVNLAAGPGWVAVAPAGADAVYLYPTRPKGR